MRGEELTGLSPPGSRASASATSRRAGGCGARSASTSICDSPPACGAVLDHRAHLRHLPSACRAQGPWRQSALRRRTADARDLARASDQSAFADHGRADRRIGAGHRRPGRGDAGAPRRGRRHVRARDRAEYRRGDGDLQERRHHGQWPRQPYHRIRRGLPPTATCNSACLASGSTAISARPRNGPARTEAGECAAARTEQGRRCGSSSPIPTLPTRWSQPVPIARIEAAARTVSTGVTRLEEVTRQRREPATTQTSGPPVVLVVGTLDTKGAELRFIRDIIADSGLRTRLVDVSTSGKASDLRRLRSGNRPEPRPRRIERVRRRPRRIGDGHGGCLCQMAAPPGQCRRHHLRGRFGRQLRWSRPACAPCPSACRR